MPRCIVHLFGSAGSGLNLGTSSDVDICVEVPMEEANTKQKQLRILSTLQDAFLKSCIDYQRAAGELTETRNQARVQLFSNATVPIITFIHPRFVRLSLIFFL